MLDILSIFSILTVSYTHLVDMASLVPDDSLTIDDGAVAPWNSFMWSLMTDVCREMGVRTDVPFRDLTEQEKDIVYHGPVSYTHLDVYKRQVLRLLKFLRRQQEIKHTMQNG